MPRDRTAPGRFPAALYLAFFLSGSAAIIYQLIWQRVLSGVYGTSVEAVTTVVASFMSGLGLGSLAGGWLADRSRVPPATLFVVIELAIGSFGLISVPLFREVGASTLDVSPALVWMIVAALLVAPTMLMGATLPILTAGVTVATAGQTPIGQAVGRLYAINTIGAAVGSVVTVLVIARLFGQHGSAQCAAVLNLTAAFLVWVTRRSW